jgi:hypothetical protein
VTLEYRPLALKRPWVPRWFFKLVANFALQFHWDWPAKLVVCDCDQCFENRDKIDDEPILMRKHW